MLALTASDFASKPRTPGAAKKPLNEVVSLVETGRPKLKGDRDILVRVIAVGLSHAAWMVVCGTHPLCATIPAGAFIILQDFVGVIEKRGRKCSSHLQEGMYVFGRLDFGAAAEYIVVHGSKCCVVDGSNSNLLQLGAGANNLLTGVLALKHHGGLRPGQNVVINGGTGSLATCTAAVARAMGAGLVIAGVSAEEKKPIAQATGVYDHVFVYDAQNVEASAKAVRELTNGGAHVTVDCVGTQALFDSWSFPVTGRRGAFVSLGAMGDGKFPNIAGNDAFPRALRCIYDTRTACEAQDPHGYLTIVRTLQALTADPHFKLPGLTHEFTPWQSEAALALFPKKGVGLSAIRFWRP